METLQKLWVGQLEVSEDYLRRLRVELFREFEGHIVTFLDDPRGQEFKLYQFSEAPVVRRDNPVAPLTPCNFIFIFDFLINFNFNCNFFFFFLQKFIEDFFILLDMNILFC